MLVLIFASDKAIQSSFSLDFLGQSLSEKSVKIIEKPEVSRQISIRLAENIVRESE